MSTGSLRLAFVIEAVDRATGRVNAIRERLEKLTETPRKIRASFRDLGQAVGLDRMRNAAGNVGESVGRLTGLVRGLATGLGVLGAAGVGAFFGIKRLADETDAIADNAARLGITTQALQELGFAAQMSGSSVDEMGQGLGFLANNLAEARQGNEQMLKTLSRIGVTMADLRDPTFSATDALARMADTYQRVSKDGLNGNEMINTSRALMGRSGDRLIQLLKQGSAGLQGYALEARRLGIVLSDETVKSMGSFNDEFDRTKLILFGNLSTALQAVMPRIQGIVERLGSWTIANRVLIGTKLTEFMDRLEQALPSIWTAAVQLATGIGAVAAACDTVAQAMGGWQVVITLLTEFMILKAVVGLLLFGKTIYGLAASMGVLSVASLPVLAGIAALVVAAGVVYAAWEPIKKLFSSIFGGAADALGKITNAPKAGAPSPYASADEWARYRQDTAIQPQTAQVGGTLRVEVVGPGRVTDVKRAKGSGMEIDAYSGPAMSGMAGA